ncbi:SDR family oxidoreductase [Salinibacterium sp. GXW1014]|uniref:SDR family oxidoreductase n=1 Tax=Salinibacterium sp. GXW1014 TaxID=3377838 RepID=UPI00383AE974
MDLSAQVVLIAGAATPVGRSVAESLADEGAQLVLTDVVDVHLAEVVDSIALRTGRRPEQCLLRVTDPEAWCIAIDDAETRFGRLDIIVNAAEWDPGVSWREAAPEHWSRAVDINLMGVVNGFAAALPALRRSEGSLVIVARDAALTGVMGASARSAALAFARSVRRDVAPEVTIVTTVVRGDSARLAGSGIVAGLRASDEEITVGIA